MWRESASVKAVNLVKKIYYSNWDNEFFLRDCFLSAHPVHCVSKNDTDVTHYNFNAHQPILLIVGTYIAEWVRYRMVISIPPLLSSLPGETWTPEIGSFQSRCLLCLL